MSSSPLTIALVAWGLSFGACVAGMWIGPRLPMAHRTSESRDLINAAATMVSTLTALALGLLLSVAEGSFDEMDSQLRATASDLMRVGHLLRLYGPEADESRALIRDYAGALQRDIFPPGGEAPDFEDAATLDMVAKAENLVALLVPQNATQRWLQPHILAVSDRLIQEYFALVKGQLGSLSPAVVVLLIAWLIVLFGAYGIYAPVHMTSLLVLLFTSAAAAGGLFLTLELDSPVGGIVRLSPDVLQHAMDMMDKHGTPP